MRKPIKRFVNSIVVLYLFALTCASFVVINLFLGPIILLWSLSKLFPLTLVWFQSTILAIWMSIFISHFEHFAGLKLVLTGDAARSDESALIVCNHTTWTDTVIMYSLARQANLHGDVKFFAKKSLIFFPVFGLIGAILHVVIFITRDYSRAKEGMDKTFSALSDPKRRQNFWLVSYLEGTRITKQKLERSQSFSKKRDLRPLRHILQPRTKGFVSSVQELRSVASCVYDVTIGYNVDGDLSPVPKFMEVLLTPCFTRERVVHVHQRRIPISQLPAEEEALKLWTYKLYEQKDDLLEKFRKTGRFPGPQVFWERMSISYALGCSTALWISFVIICNTGLSILQGR